MESIDLSQAMWRKSSKSGPNGQCVEVAFVRDWIAVRDSKHPTGQVLFFTLGEWDAFVGGVADGKFTHP